MSNRASRNIRLGIVVLLGFIFLVFTMYVIGAKQNLFGSNFEISANFKNVNGLMEGNNVRLLGMNAGTVTEVSIINDSTVKVDMVIENKYQNYIKKNSVASVGTDGLMGNKLVNITPVKEPGAVIQEGDVLLTSLPFETETIFKTLGQTNEDIAVIASNLKSFSEKMNDPNSFWGLLSDTTISNTLTQVILEIRQTSKNAVAMTDDLALIVGGVRSGEGSMGALFKDTTFSVKLNQTMTNLQSFSDSLIVISESLQVITTQIADGNGAVGTILTDSTFDSNLIETMKNLKKSSVILEENLEALKHNILFRRYFKKQAKETND